MIAQVLLAKRQFLEGIGYSRRPDAVSCGMAISMFQDAVETVVWALIKARNIAVNDNSAFTTNLDLLRKDGLAIPEAPRLLELNKARVGLQALREPTGPRRGTQIPKLRRGLPP